MNFSQKDINQFEEKGISSLQIEKQLELFNTGIPYISLREAATINNGVFKYTKTEEEAYITKYKALRDTITMTKFVPASGAATRMFKFLFQFLEHYKINQESLNTYINKYDTGELRTFIVGIEKFPFYKAIHKTLKESVSNYKALGNNDKVILFIETLLDHDKKNYGTLPKGLLPFHIYKKTISSAFEEHLFEGAAYASSKNIAKLHFTISEQHETLFKKALKEKRKSIEDKTETVFDVSFSFQNSNTDTVSVKEDLTIYRDDKDNIVFRPSGHGALLYNLNQIESDLVFIKNIDNVVTYKHQEVANYYKKMLAGVLLTLQEQIFEYQLKLVESTEVSEKERIEIAQFLNNKLNVVIAEDFEKYSSKYQIDYLIEKLNRPIRVCGMVKNEGEPGGGPFWVYDSARNVSLQIIEASQIDLNNPNQAKIVDKATHFNPVDIVCSTKNYNGEYFDLDNYKDPNTGFITSKSHLGNTIKALELPGLWNGSMAKWNSVFIEIPLSTFNPVKSVNDLLKPAHQV